MINLDKFDKKILVQGEREICIAILQEVVKGIAIYKNVYGEVFKILPKDRLNARVARGTKVNPRREP